MVISKSQLRAVARPHLDLLSKQSRMTAQLAVWEKGSAVYVDIVLGPNDVPFLVVGNRDPASTVSTGKVLLAWRGAGALNQALQRLTKLTPKTITDIDKIQADLQATLSRGYAINRGECRPNTGGIAAPVFNQNGTCVASVGFCARPIKGLLGAKRAELARIVTQAAAAITRDLGGTPVSN